MIKLGSDILDKQHVQFVVPKNVYEGLFIADGKGFSLMGTNMTPGFMTKTVGSRGVLLKLYPAARKYIIKLT
ncbi:MAG: hypothetical protein K940chlam7_01749 [Chlamydiae bacterium]|nr:hypothetical protein [Chlamydiota bacterium]